MGIRRIVYFRARGNRLCDFVNAVRRSDIRCFSQRFIYEEYTGQISYSDLGKLRILAGEYQTELYIEGYSGKLFGVFRYRKRYGIIAGAAALAAGMIMINHTVLRIEVNGNRKITEAHVLSLLEENGLKCGFYLNSPDLREYEFMLERELPGVGWAGVRKSGSRVVVDIHEIGDKPSTVKNNIPCNVVSLHDAVVVSVRNRNGKCIVHEGDAVSKGDILISGVMNEEENDLYRIVHAQGDITGEYTDTQIFRQNFTVSEKACVSKVQKKYLEFAWMRIPVPSESADTGGAECIERKDLITLFGIELPVGIVYHDYSIYRNEEVLYSEEQASELAEKQISRYENNFLSKCEIKEKQTRKKCTDEYLEYEVTYRLRGEIGTEGNLFVNRKNTNEEAQSEDELQTVPEQ